MIRKIILALLLLCAATAFGQVVYDLPCAAGTSPLANSVTVNPVNGHLKAYLCVDTSGNVTSPVLGAGLQISTTSISSAQILQLNSTPVQIVPAPGAGKVIQVVTANCNYIPGGTAYTASGHPLNFSYGAVGNGNTINTTSNTSFLQNGTLGLNTLQIFINPNQATQGMSTSQIINTPLFIYDATANPTLGNGTMTCNVMYTTYSVQ